MPQVLQQHKARKTRKNTKKRESHSVVTFAPLACKASPGHFFGLAGQPCFQTGFQTTLSVHLSFKKALYKGDRQEEQLFQKISLPANEASISFYITSTIITMNPEPWHDVSQTSTSRIREATLVNASLSAPHWRARNNCQTTLSLHCPSKKAFWKGV